VIALRNAGWLTISRLGSDVLGLMLFVAISRRLGPAGTGVYAYGFAVAGLISIGGTLGLEEYGIREYARGPRHARVPLLASLLGVQWLMTGGALLALAGVLISSSPEAHTAGVLLCLSTYMLTGALAQTLFIPAYAEQAMSFPAFADLGCRAGASLAAIAALQLGHESLAISLAGFPLAGLVLVGIAAGSARARLGSLPGPSSLRAVIDMAREVWSFAASELVFQIYTRSGLILISLLAGEAVAGIYASGSKFIDVGIMPLVFLGVASYPALSDGFGRDPARFAVLARDLMRSTLFLAGLLGWGLWFVVPAVIVPLLGERFAPAREVVHWMAGVAVVYAAEIALVRLMLAAHLQIERLRLLAICTVVSLLVNVALISAFGLGGAIGGAVLTFAAIDAMYALALARRVPALQLGTLFAGYAAVVIAALIAGIAAQELEDSVCLAAGSSLLVFVGGCAMLGLLPPLPRLTASEAERAAGHPATESPSRVDGGG
jgi:O-antigen/teichoic acid export membrane protein